MVKPQQRASDGNVLKNMKSNATNDSKSNMAKTLPNNSGNLNVM